MRRLILFVIGAMIWMTACASAAETPTATAVPAPEQAAATEVATKTAVPTATDLPATATPEPTAEPAPTETSVPTEEPAAEAAEPETPALGPVQSEAVVVEAADGLALAATVYAAEGLADAPGVILLHMLGSNRQIWESVGLVDELAANGYAVLALDMRGHGETGSSQDWGLAADDIQRVWQYFVERPEVDEGRTAVVGASIGSNMALIATANEPAVRTAVLLSPGLVYRGVTIEDRLPDVGDRPLLLVASEDDYYSEETVLKLAETAVGETEVKIYEEAGHGTNMFEPQPDLIPLILDWLNGYLLAPE